MKSLALRLKDLEPASVEAVITNSTQRHKEAKTQRSKGKAIKVVEKVS